MSPFFHGGGKIGEKMMTHMKIFQKTNKKTHYSESYKMGRGKNWSMPFMDSPLIGKFCINWHRKIRCALLLSNFILRRILKSYLSTVFLQIVSAEIFLFWIQPYVLWPYIQVRKLFKRENYSGRKLYEEIRYAYCGNKRN